MKYIDVHAHFEDKKFDEDRYDVLKSCKEKDIVVVNASGNKEGNRSATEMQKKFPALKLCLGIFPPEAVKMSDKEFNDELKFIEENSDKIIGIGEVGVDFYWVKDELERKKEMDKFTEIVWLANKLKLPLNVHSRDAESETIAILAKTAHVPVILHAFGGDEEQAKAAVKFGFYISVPPVLIRSDKHQRVIKAVPITNILTETDSPYLGPTKERNDPRKVPIVIEKIAELKGLDTEEVRKQIMENAKKVFNI